MVAPKHWENLDVCDACEVEIETEMKAARSGGRTRTMKKVYKYSENFRRSGSLSGVFVASESDVTRVRDAGRVYLGEVLGKHSEVTAIIDDETLRLISDDPAIVRFFEEHLDSGVGMNPVRRWLDSDDEDEA